MDVEQVNLFLGLLTFVALILAAATVATIAAGRLERLRPYGELLVPLALAIALTATLGSLYYSGVEHYRPCRLCWWQRIFMYPLPILLAVGLLRRDRSVAWYGLPLALVGLGHSIYHVQLQWFPEQGDGSCSVEAPCTVQWVDTFGFVSIPFMAGAGFAAVAALLGAQLLLDRRRTDAPDARGATEEPTEEPTEDVPA